ncbi:MAG: hypothetical protein HY237_06470, partial [Acidobacteria bacterium]|nr:hypothetical protein [Acidobacteriota bacterium]
MTYTAQVFQKSPGCRARKQRAPDIPVVTAEGALEYHVQQQPMVSRGATVEAAHIVRAYVYGNLAAQKRIELYGKLEREKWDALMTPFRPDPNPGPVLTHWNAGPLSTNGQNSTRVDDLPDESSDYDDPQSEDP